MTQAFDITTPPAKEDADDAGNVNYFHPKLGWTEGDWRFPVYSDVTHWARLPKRPAVVDQEVVIAAAFDVWIGTFPDTFEPSAKALLKTGFRAGYRKAKAARS